MEQVLVLLFNVAKLFPFGDTKLRQIRPIDFFLILISYIECFVYTKAKTSLVGFHFDSHWLIENRKHQFETLALAIFLHSVSANLRFCYNVGLVLVQDQPKHRHQMILI